MIFGFFVSMFQSVIIKYGFLKRFFMSDTENKETSSSTTGDTSGDTSSTTTTENKDGKKVSFFGKILNGLKKLADVASVLKSGDGDKKN